jgi:D-alanyl-D-alanine carboxypeptidase
MVKKRVLANAMVVLIMFGITNMPVVHAQSGIIPPNALSQTVLIDKSHPLRPLDYSPPELTVPPVLLAELPSNDPEMQVVPVTADTLNSLFKAAQSDGMTLVLSSGYRSYNDQSILYTSSLENNGSAAAEAVARPGYSEHQSGLAVDVILSDYFCAAQGCFTLSRAAVWLSQDAYRYGFIVRYPLHKEASTGYEYEPWHLRYVGIPLAERLHASGQTLEEFYGLP